MVTRLAVLDRLRDLTAPIRTRAIDRLPGLLEAFEDLLRRMSGPRITAFTPAEGRAGCTVTIDGANFSGTRDQNQVVVGGRNALVVSASASQLVVITDPEVTDGPAEVTVASKTATSSTDFRVLPYPLDDEDGPPILFTGAGEGMPGELPASGTTRVLAALVNPTDRVPSAGSTARQTVVQSWDAVQDYYGQASFGTKTIQVDVMANWATLTGSTADYVDFVGEQNIKKTVLPRLYAEAAKAAQDAGFNLNNYGVLAVTLFLNGDFIRAWNSGQTQSFSYDPGPGGAKISITLTQGINELAVQESANWGRLAHEVGHGLVDRPSGLPTTETKSGGGLLVFGEDVYQSDLVDPNAATADSFDLMGDHDRHPLFSAYYMEQLGWYRPDNPAHDQDVRDLTWNRNAFSQDFEIVAHGGVRNTVAGRYHAIKIKVASGLFYYLEVRQRPGTVVFDGNIPVGTAPHQGGLVVTKVVTDTVNNNQQFRFITLLHDKVVLKANESAVDPARDLTITVLDDGVADRPLVCRVRVAWAQGVADDPKGAFDLSITPWDTSTWSTPDIWVDRMAYGTFDKPLDAGGRPELNGDKPKRGEINKIYARINCGGTVGATNVKVTYYVVEPPGVGDNGNWAPLITRTIATIPANGHFDLTADWVPLVGRHTCLKVYASTQFGEVSGGNNWAQENVFEFEAPAFSPPAPVIIPLAIRNPRDEATVAMINIGQVPRSYRVQFPHAWVHLQAHEERQFDLIVVPLWDVTAYVEKGREAPSVAPVRIEGLIPRQYDEPLSTGELPASTFRSIGGVLNRVRPVRSTSIELAEDLRRSTRTVAAVQGSVSHAHEGDRLRVVFSDSAGRPVVEETRTDDSGHFATRLDLSLTAQEAGRGPDDVGGTYTAQAHTFAADTVAEASSNVVTIVR
jgi:hypothetical protein